MQDQGDEREREREALRESEGGRDGGRKENALFGRAGSTRFDRGSVHHSIVCYVCNSDSVAGTEMDDEKPI